MSNAGNTQWRGQCAGAGTVRRGGDRGERQGAVSMLRALVSPHAIERILSSLSHCESCVEGTGLYWFTEVESSGRL